MAGRFIFGARAFHHGLAQHRGGRGDDFGCRCLGKKENRPFEYRPHLLFASPFLHLFKYPQRGLGGFNDGTGGKLGVGL